MSGILSRLFHPPGHPAIHGPRAIVEAAESAVNLAFWAGVEQGVVAGVLWTTVLVLLVLVHRKGRP